jgi:hypothetical protein
MAASKTINLSTLFDKQEKKAAVVTFKTKDGEDIEIRGKSDLDEEYETFMDDERSRLGIVKGNEESLEDVHMTELARIALLAITHPDDRDKWELFEQDRGEKLGAFLLQELEQQMQEGLIAKKEEGRTGAQKRS